MVRETDGVSKLLTAMGAPAAARDLVQDHRGKNSATQGLRLHEVNKVRAAEAAARSSDAVEHALGVLGDDVPEHLVQVATLRLAHRTASLHELGQLVSPAMTKDTVAGRIKTLLTAARRVEQERDAAGAA